VRQEKAVMVEMAALKDTLAARQDGRQETLALVAVAVALVALVAMVVIVHQVVLLPQMDGALAMAALEVLVLQCLGFLHLMEHLDLHQEDGLVEAVVENKAAAAAPVLAVLAAAELAAAPFLKLLVWMALVAAAVVHMILLLDLPEQVGLVL